MLWFRLSILFITSLGLFESVLAAPAAHVRVQVLPESPTYIAGAPLRVAFVMDVEEGWHTYWTHPGTAGEPASVAWKLPRGWMSQGLAFPVPTRTQEKEFVTFGYTGRVVLFDTLVAPGNAKGPVTVRGKLSWLVCKEACLPEDKDVSFVVRPAARKTTPPVTARLFAEWAPRIPQPDRSVKAVLKSRWFGGWNLEVTASVPGEAEFLPSTREGVNVQKPIRSKAQGGKWVFRLDKDGAVPLKGNRVTGIVVPVQGKAFSVSGKM